MNSLTQLESGFYWCSEFPQLYSGGTEKGRMTNEYDVIRSVYDCCVYRCGTYLSSNLDLYGVEKEKMSLTITHGCWSGSCSDFGDWRNVIAQTAGYNLEEVGAFIR